MNIEDWFENIKSRPYHSESQSTTNPYGFVIGWEGGRGYVLGPYNTEEATNTMALEKFSPDHYIIVWSMYSDRGRVTQGMKHERLSSGDSIQEATRRMKHD